MGEKILHEIPLICSPLPDSFEICGRRYPIETDFRRWITLTQVLDSDVSPAVKLECIRMTIIPAIGKEDMDFGCDEGEFYRELFREITRFASCGRVSETDSGRSMRAGAEFFDFASDADYIYSAFYSVYGIDLSEVRMHWWKFVALLTTLPPECGLMRVIAIRKSDIGKIEDDEMRKRLRRAKAAVRIR